MKTRRWLVLALSTVTLVTLGITARWWVPLLLAFVGAHSDVIQGLTDLVQLVFWVGAGLSLLNGLWQGLRQEKYAGERPGATKSDDIILVTDPDLLWKAIRSRSPAQDLRHSTERYLKHLVDRHRYLDFKGMGVSDRVPLRLSLIEMYVPLKARIELPEGETWARQLRLAGRQISDEETEAIGSRLSKPTPVLDLLQQHDGLIILGDPGAGKTTFLKYLALRLALGEGESLGLGTRLPILLPLSAYANALAARDVPLDRFIADYYHDRGVDLPIGSMLKEAMVQGGALLLLDGLDEVKDLVQRHLVVERVVDFFTFHRQRGNKFILTSRIVGYREVRPTAEGLAECTLVDFEDEEIAQFVERWTEALERAARGDTHAASQEAALEKQELLTAVHRNPGMRRLASNPLLLTILALMKRQGVTLPDRRVELYQKYVETLIRHWNLVRGLGRPTTRDLDLVETVRVLAPLALWMHETSPGVGLVKREDMRRKLEEIYVSRGLTEPERAARKLLSDVREYAGLLLERGPGEYGFIHLTFQEYLAAVAITQIGQQDVEPVIQALAAHIGDDNWHEVALLTIGHIGIVQQRDEAAGAILQGLIQVKPGKAGQAAVLAGEAVVDVWPGGVTLACRAAVVRTLQETLVDDDRKVEPPLRAAAGDALARLGDPRPGVGLRSDGLPDIVWCEVAAGPFVMGSLDDLPDCIGGETPQCEINLPAFHVSKYPVTNVQYAAFVQDGGYTEKWSCCWTDAGRHWKNDTAGPAALGDVFDLSNHPIVMVTWYEAVAFCRWLTACLCQTGDIGTDEEVTLPTEAQWEKAARGSDTRVFPWGDDVDTNRSNYRDTRIRTTSAVGCFPGGASPYGALDMSGNVWEWCRTKFRESYRQYQDDSNDIDDDLEGDAARVSRGGSFNDYFAYVRCASRNWNDPDNAIRDLGFRVILVRDFYSSIVVPSTSTSGANEASSD